MIKKAIIPAAGYGTRFLPASKSIPKEMIPVVDKPTIQYVVEEAVEAGIEDILMIVSAGKHAIQEHFSPHRALENQLATKGKKDVLEAMQKLSDLARIQYIHQKEMRGLGDAVLYAREFAGNEPVAILLGDTIIQSNTEESVLQSMIRIHDNYQGAVVALRKVPRSRINQYGVVAGEMIEDRIIEIEQLVEKPAPEKAPSQLAVSARYIVTPKLFDYLQNTEAGHGGEIQITDALNTLAKQDRMFGFQFDGQRFDIGDKLEFIKSNVLMGLKQPEMTEQLKQFLSDLAHSDFVT